MPPLVTFYPRFYRLQTVQRPSVETLETLPTAETLRKSPYPRSLSLVTSYLRPPVHPRSLLPLITYYYMAQRRRKCRKNIQFKAVRSLKRVALKNLEKSPELSAPNSRNLSLFRPKI
jgi:hypothetical protein